MRCPIRDDAGEQDDQGVAFESDDLLAALDRRYDVDGDPPSRVVDVLLILSLGVVLSITLALNPFR